MPKKTVKIPAYRLHKGTGQAIVQINGARHYLGKFGSEKSQERYRRLVAEILATPTALPKPGKRTSPPPTYGSELEVVQVSAAYWEWAKGYYTKDGRPTGQVAIIRRALSIVRKHYAHVPATEFGPLAMRAVQRHLVEQGLARETVNHMCRIIRHMFKWATSHEMLPVTIYQALVTVPGLRKGRTAAREPEPIGPVPDEMVDATLPSLAPVVADMVRFQQLTGCRPGEACIIRPCDVDRSGSVWCYRPESHKTEHHDRERFVMIGPHAQEVLRPYLLRAADAYCFSPAEAEKQQRASRRAARKTPLSYGNSPGTNRKSRPKQRARDRYIKDSYNRAIQRGCEAAFGMPKELRYIPKKTPEPEKKRLQQLASAWRAEYCWSPNQLRHSAATKIRKQFGLEAAQVALGHSEANVTQIYAERDMTLASEVMRKIG